MRLLLLLPLLVSCANYQSGRGGYTLGFSIGYEGIQAGVTYARAAQAMGNPITPLTTK